jgi:serine/threonine protein kinase
LKEEGMISMSQELANEQGQSGRSPLRPDEIDEFVTKAETNYSLPPGKLDLSPGSEPIPNYILDRRIGRGGFGEVWAALAPGGVTVAIKFIPLDGQVGDVELRALDLMKNIRHPHLTGVSGIWRGEQMLVIAMELGDRTLMDCLKEAKAQGQDGINFELLCEFMKEAAKGIDYLNTLHIAHRDIKPQNLLLLSGGVKVADFGLAKLLDQTLVSNTGAMTPAYSAPELFNGQASGKSDQYALAISYCQLRGGRLPFEGTIAQLMAGHLNKDPDISMIPEAERPIVARALAKDPADRWPDCRSFAQALSQVGSSPTASSDRLAAVAQLGAASRRRFLLVGLILVGAFALGATGLISYFKGGRDPLVEMRRQEIDREVEAIKAIQPPTLLAHSPDYSEVDQLEPDDNSAFEILSDDRVVDLRSWKEVPADRTHELYSAVSQARRIRLRKIKPAKFFQTQGRTSGSDVFMRCLSLYPSREIGQKGDAFVGTDRMKVRRLLIDVSNVPEQVEFDLRIVSTYWNSLQSESELWFGIMGYKKSFKVSLLLMFPPEKSFTDYSLKVARTIKDKPLSYEGSKIFQSGLGREWVYWEVPNPKEGYVYRLDWKW